MRRQQTKGALCVLPNRLKPHCVTVFKILKIFLLYSLKNEIRYSDLMSVFLPQMNTFENPTRVAKLYQHYNNKEKNSKYSILTGLGQMVSDKVRDGCHHNGHFPCLPDHAVAQRSLLTQ